MISDGTGSIDATFFNDAVVQLIGVSCNNIIESTPNIDMHRLPSIIQDSIGSRAKFHVQAQRNDRNGSTRCIINGITRHVIDETKDSTQTNPAAPETPQKQVCTTLPTTSSSIKRQLYIQDGKIITS